MSIRLTSLARAVSSVRSTGQMRTAVWDSSSSASASSSRSLTERASRMRLWSRARSLATASPIPEVAPVMRAMGRRWWRPEPARVKP